jgi:hypothetical protein
MSTQQPRLLTSRVTPKQESRLIITNDNDSDSSELPEIIIDNKACHPIEILFDEANNSSNNNNNNNNNASKKCFTMFCDRWIATGECLSEHCTYAHSIDQLRRNKCFRDKQCKNRWCNYKHTDQTPEDFMMRNKLTLFNQKNQIQSCIIQCPNTQSDTELFEIIQLARNHTRRQAITLVFSQSSPLNNQLPYRTKTQPTPMLTGVKNDKH